MTFLANSSLFVANCCKNCKFGVNVKIEEKLLWSTIRKNKTKCFIFSKWEGACKQSNKYQYNIRFGIIFLDLQVSLYNFQISLYSVYEANKPSFKMRKLMRRESSGRYEQKRSRPYEHWWLRWKGWQPGVGLIVILVLNGSIIMWTHPGLDRQGHLRMGTVLDGRRVTDVMPADPFESSRE